MCVYAWVLCVPVFVCMCACVCVCTRALTCSYRQACMHVLMCECGLSTSYVIAKMHISSATYFSSKSVSADLVLGVCLNFKDP